MLKRPRVPRLAGFLFAALAVSSAHGSMLAAERPGGAGALASVALRAGLRPEVLELAVRAHARAVKARLTTDSLVTVIDYSLPSRERRLWILDLAEGRVLAHELVAHGRGTGDDVAARFSNRPGSFQSSLGTFITAETYQGKHGLSLRLRGVDPELNGRAWARAIVMHGADYVSQGIIEKLGRLGRSEGCPALEAGVAPRVINLIRGGTVLFAYYPSAALERTLEVR